MAGNVFAHGCSFAGPLLTLPLLEVPIPFGFEWKGTGPASHSVQGQGRVPFSNACHFAQLPGSFKKEFDAGPAPASLIGSPSSPSFFCFRKVLRPKIGARRVFLVGPKKKEKTTRGADGEAPGSLPGQARERLARGAGRLCPICPNSAV